LKSCQIVFFIRQVNNTWISAAVMYTEMIVFFNVSLLMNIQ
jgi:hypothetical protein